jgi:hypothetical protein
MAMKERQPLASYESIFRLPRPRQVRLKAVPKILLGAFPVASAFLFYFNVQEIRNLLQMGAHLSQFDGVSFELIFPVLMIAASSVTLWMVRRDKALLRDGEFAMGVVTHQRLTGRRRKTSRIRYQFRSLSGQMLQGAGTDYSRRVRVDMTVPVFYKRENPEMNVTLCAATCELRVG